MPPKRAIPTCFWQRVVNVGARILELSLAHMSLPPFLEGKLEDMDYSPLLVKKAIQWPHYVEGRITTKLTSEYTCLQWLCTLP